MSGTQIAQAVEIMKKNLETHTDWIVLNATMDTLGKWATKDGDLKTYLLPHLERLCTDERKSVSGRAKKMLKQLEIQP